MNVREEAAYNGCPLSKESMSDRRVLLVASGNAAQLALVHEDKRVFILRDDEPVPGAEWGEADLNAAADAFHRLMTEDEIL
jgi:hypothetical protein